MRSQCQRQPISRSTMRSQCQRQPISRSTMGSQCQRQPTLRSTMESQCQHQPVSRSTMGSQCQQWQVVSLLCHCRNCLPTVEYANVILRGILYTTILTHLVVYCQQTYATGLLTQLPLASNQRRQVLDTYSRGGEEGFCWRAQMSFL